MGVIVSAVEADLECDHYGAGQTYSFCTLLLATDDLSHFVTIGREVSNTRDEWLYACSGVGYTYFAGGDGTARIEIAENGADIDWEVFVDGVSKATGTLAGTATDNWAGVRLTVVKNAPDNDGHNRNTRTKIEMPGHPITYGWDDAGELDEWGTYSTVPKPTLTGSYITAPTGTGGGALWNVFTPPPTLSATIAAPGILRRTVSYNGDALTYYESSAGTHILSGSSDLHPELLHLGANSAELALILQRDEQGASNVYYSIGGGAEAAGAWGAVQQIRADRSYPCGTVLQPSHDLYVIGVETTTNIAYGQRLAWNGSSYTIGTEGIVSSGDVAGERGFVAWDRGKGRLLFSYADTDGVVQLLTSDDMGGTWA